MTHRSASPALDLAMFAALMAVGCTSSPQTTTVHHRDSSGVDIVDNLAPVWAENSSWTLADSAGIDLPMGVGPGPDPLSSASAVIPLSDGSAVIMDDVASRLRAYDSTGVQELAMGRQGDGPGEFRAMNGLFRCVDDTVMVNQGYAVSVFDRRLRFIRRTPVPRPAGSVFTGIEGVSADCRFILVAIQQVVPPLRGRYSDPFALVWTATDSTVVDTAFSFPGPDLTALSIEGRAAGAAVPFGRRAVWAVNGDQLYFGPADRAEVRVFDRRSGLRRIVRWNAVPEAVTTLDRADYSRRRADYLQANPEEAVAFRELDAYPVPRTKPLYSQILADDRGHIWLRRYPRSAAGLPRINKPDFGDQPESWWVIDATGRFLGTVSVPSSFELLAVDHGQAWGSVVDARSNQHLRRYRVMAR